MASLLKLSKFLNKNVIVNSTYNLTLARHGSYAKGTMVGHWNWDWMPETVPVTPEQRAHAAEKYGLRVEDYKPFPDNGFPLGDYPDLPPVSQNSRSPYEDWDIPEVKRNYKEPISVDSDMLREDLYDANARHKNSVYYMLSFILGILGFNFVVVYLMRNYKRHQAVLKKQFPADLKEGQIHYTFKPAQ